MSDYITVIVIDIVTDTVAVAVAAAAAAAAVTAQSLLKKYEYDNMKVGARTVEDSYAD